MENPIFRLLKDKFLSEDVCITIANNSIWVSTNRKYREITFDEETGPIMLVYDNDGHLTQFHVALRINMPDIPGNNIITIVSNERIVKLDLCDPNSIGSLMELVAGQINEE